MSCSRTQRSDAGEVQVIFNINLNVGGFLAVSMVHRILSENISISDLHILIFLSIKIVYVTNL